MNYTWTKPMDRTLTSMRQMGCTWPQVGRALNVSDAAAKGRWKRLQSGVVSREEQIRRKVEQYLTHPDASTPAFANHAMHLRLMAQAMLRGEHLPKGRVA